MKGILKETNFKSQWSKKKEKGKQMKISSDDEEGQKEKGALPWREGECAH